MRRSSTLSYTAALSVESDPPPVPPSVPAVVQRSGSSATRMPVPPPTAAGAGRLLRFGSRAVYASVASSPSEPATQSSVMSISNGLSPTRRASSFMMRVSDSNSLIENGVEGVQRGAVSAASSFNSTTSSRVSGGSSVRKSVTIDGDDGDSPRTPSSLLAAAAGARRSSIIMRASEGSNQLSPTVNSPSGPSAAFFSNALAARRSSILMRASEGNIKPEVSEI